MTIVNIKSFQIAMFKVENSLHVTVSNNQSLNEAYHPVDMEKLKKTDIAMIIGNHFSDTFKRNVTTVDYKKASNIFHPSFKTLIIIVK